MLPESEDRSLLRRSDAALPPSGAWTYTVPKSVETPDDSNWLQQLSNVLRRGRLTIAVLGALGLLIAIASTVMQVPVYRARVLLQLEGFNENFLKDVAPTSPLLANASAENYVRNQINVLQSGVLAKRVAERLGIQPVTSSGPAATKSGLIRELAKKTRFLPETAASADEQRIAQVQGALNVRMIPQTHTIEIVYDDKDPRKAAEAADAIASEFIALNREARWQMVQDTTEWLTKQTAELKAKLEMGNQRLQQYARSSGLMFAGDSQTLEYDRMHQLQNSLAAADADLAVKQSRYESALSNSPDSLPDALISGPLRQYQTDLQTLQRQLAELRAQYTPAHYKVVRLKAQIAALESAITKEKRAIIARLKTEHQAATRLHEILAAATARESSQLQKRNAKEAQYNVLKREVESTQQLYESMLQKVKEAGIASAMRSTNIRIIDPARVPVRPYSPNPVINLAVGLGVGLIGGTGLAFLRERAGIVRRPGDVTSLDVAELGVIPSARNGGQLPVPGLRFITARPTGKVELVTLQDDTSLLSESFRSVLASILFSAETSCQANPRSGRVLVLSSTEAMEGKTTVVTNLGIALAETRGRVLLIDADTRRPRLHDILGVSNDWGLADLLRKPQDIEMLPIERLSRPTDVQNLCLLPSGSDLKGAAKLFHSVHMTTLLRRLRAEFDLILVDTPPLMLYADARVLGRRADGVVLVVRANKAKTDQLRAVSMRLMRDGVPLLGAILNEWTMDREQMRTYENHRRYYTQAN